MEPEEEKDLEGLPLLWYRGGLQARPWSNNPYKWGKYFPEVRSILEMVWRFAAGEPPPENPCPEDLLPHLRLLVHFLRGRCTPETFPDMFQEGFLGMLNHLYTWDRVHSFSGWMKWGILSHVLRAQAEDRLIRLPAHIPTLNSKLDEVEARGGKMTPSLAKGLGMRWDTLQRYRILQEDVELRPSLINAPAPQDPEEDAICREDGKALGAVLQKCLDALPLRECLVLYHHFGLDGLGARTLEETGSLMNVTRERVRQIKIRALRRLGRSKMEGILQSFYDVASDIPPTHIPRLKVEVSPALSNPDPNYYTKCPECGEFALYHRTHLVLRKHSLPVKRVRKERGIKRVVVQLEQCPGEGVDVSQNEDIPDELKWTRCPSCRGSGKAHGELCDLAVEAAKERRRKSQEKLNRLREKALSLPYKEARPLWSLASTWVHPIVARRSDYCTPECGPCPYCNGSKKVRRLLLKEN